MKRFQSFYVFHRSKAFRINQLAFGLLIGFFMVTIAFTEIKASDDQKVNAQPQNTELNETTKDKKDISSSNRNHSINYHNFLTSYFLNESSVERKRSKSTDEKEQPSRLKRIQQSLESISLILF